LIGNDIIAISELPDESESRFSRRIAKVCNREEASWLYSLEKQHRKRAFWSLWAVKEAAWKTDFRRGGGRIFNPHRFNCRLVMSETNNGVIEEHWVAAISHMQMKCKLILTPSYIHALARDILAGDSTVYADIVRLSSKNALVQSEELRTAAKIGLSDFFDFRYNDFQIIKDNRGVPGVFAAGCRLPCSLSLSHHGHWGAWSIAFKNERCN
jgi:phosphopantetheinyl transferase